MKRVVGRGLDIGVTLLLAAWAAILVGHAFVSLWAPKETLDHPNPPARGVLLVLGAIVGFVPVLLLRLALGLIQVRRLKRRLPASD